MLCGLNHKEVWKFGYPTSPKGGNPTFLFWVDAGWFEGSCNSCSCPTSPLDLKLAMSPRRVHNSSCDEVVSGRGIGLGIIVNMDNSRESTAILVRPSHHVNANIDDEEEEYTPVTHHHKPKNNNSYTRKQLVYDNCGDKKLRSLFDISPTPARVYDDIKATGEKKTFCSIECRSMQIAQMEEESIKKKTIMRNKHDCGSSTSYTPQQVPVSRFSGHGHGQMCWIYVLDEQIPTINDNSTQEEIEAHQKHYDDANKVSCIMAASMSPELQKTFEFTWAYEMNQQLKEMFQAKASKERLDVVKSLMACKPKPGASICAFVLEMKGYFDRLESLNMVFDAELSINIILSGLPADYNQFVLSYQMNGKETSIMELHSLLQTSEQGIKKIDVPSISAAPVLTVASPCKGIYETVKCIDNGNVILNVGSSNELDKSKLWHYRLGHINKKRIAQIQKDRVLESFEFKSNDVCEACLLGKMTKSPFIGTCERGEGLLDLVHTDVCGPFQSTTKDGKHYYVTFTDDFSRYGYVYLIKHKSDTFEVFKKYQNEVENQLGRKIKVLRSDRGGEYLSIKFFDHLKNCGIVSQLTPPRTPQLNGVAERRNRTLLDMVRSMMCRATLPISFWGYALETAAHILNLVPTKKVSKTPFEMWKGKRPSLGHIKIWGCEVFVRREAQDKLEARSEKCLFVGYPKESFGYLFYKPKDNVVFVARRGVFLEREMISKEDSGSKIDLEEIQESVDEEPIVNTDSQQEVVTPVEPNDVSLPIRRTSRVSKPPQDPQFYYGFHIEEDKISDSTLSELDEPANYKEAMASPEAAKWKEAMKSEIQSMYDNQVWNLVDTTTGLKTVGCKWIFKKKTDMDGKVHTYKARLVAKGYTQTHGIDYEKTFSPVAKIKSIRIMLAIAAFHDYEIWQMDVNQNRFLTVKTNITSRSWNLCFHEKVKQFGFSRSEDESCIYIKVSGSVVVFLVLYVDDILLIGNDIPTLQSVKDWLGKCFAMKDMGDATYILGIKIYRDRSKRLIGLSQDTYLDKILKRFRMENSKKGSLPLHHGIKISNDLCPITDKELDKMSRVPYALAIGSIMYAMTCTRPDVSFALSIVSQHQQNPGEGHWTAVKNILKYLRNTKDRFLVYGGEKELRVTGYCDAGWQTDKDDSQSQSGWVFLLNGGAVTWRSSKQNTMADSTWESEYIAASEASKEVIWMKNFIGDLRVVQQYKTPLKYTVIMRVQSP
ncbi:putative RNA-directed DNA polymerase [Tanacetum coccineum]